MVVVVVVVRWEAKPAEPRVVMSRWPWKRAVWVLVLGGVGRGVR